MSRIITVTLNPAIDKSTSVDKVVTGKKLHCSKPVFQPGGGGVNVARAITKLGGKATALYFGGGYSGKFYRQLLANENVLSCMIEIESHTRENLIVLDKSSNEQYRFNMPGPDITDQELEDLFTDLSEMEDVSVIVVSGSIPPGIPEDIVARIAAIAKSKKAKMVVDCSGPALRKALEEGVYLAKPNLHELSQLSGRETLQLNEVEQAARQVIRSTKVQIIVVSLGGEGAMMVTKDFTEFVKAPVVNIKSTVGAGDSMVAGMVLAVSMGRSYGEVLRYGIACGTAATMNAGTALCDREDVSRLYSKLASKKKEYV